MFKLGELVGGAVDTVASSWLELAWTAQDSYAWRVLVVNLPMELIGWIGDIFGIETWDAWITSGIFGQLPEFLWDEIMEQVGDLKNIYNAKIYSTLIADSDTSGYGVEQTSSKPDFPAAPDRDIYYDYLTDITHLPERFRKIAEHQTVTTSTDTKESNEDRKV